MFLPKSNRIVSKSNRMTFSIFDTIWFDFDKNMNKKNLENDKKNEIFTKHIHKGGCQIFVFIVDKSFKNWPFSCWPIFFHDCWCSFISKRIVFRIESISNWNRIKRSLQLLDQKLNRNWFDLTPLGLDFFFQNILITTTEKRTVKPENAFKDTAFRVPLKLSNLKSGCKVAVLDLMLNKRPPIASCRSALQLIKVGVLSSLLFRF